MLKIVDEQTFTRTVSVRVPTGDGFATETLKATFRVLPTDHTDVADFETEAGVRGFLSDAIACLDDLVDDAGKPLAFNDDLLQQVLTIPYVRAALLRAYLDNVGGAKEGN